MKYLYQIWSRMQRILVIVFAAIGYLAFGLLSVQYFLAHNSINLSLLRWISFGFLALTSFFFFSVGSLVWLYARNRRVALLLLCFSLAMIGVVVTEIINENGSFIYTIGYICSAMAVPLASALFLLFPRDYLSLSQANIPIQKSVLRFHQSFSINTLLKSYIYLLSLLAIITALLRIFSNYGLLQTSSWLRTIIYAYYAVSLISILAIILSSYFQTSSMRERQQLRLFVSGVILSITPFLLLTIFPKMLNLPSKYIIDNQYTSVAFSLFPLTLGYSILRYQILVLDSYVRRAVSGIMGIIGLVLLIYLSIALFDGFLSGNVTHNILIYVICVTSATAIFSPFIWWLAKIITERLFFSEILHYRRLIDDPTLIPDETLDLENASHLLVAAAIHTFETNQACLFVFDEISNAYRLMPMGLDDTGNTYTHALIQTLLRSLKSSSFDRTDSWLEVHLSAIERLRSARRPLLLSEATRTEAETPRGLNRYLTSGSALGAEDWLLAPVRAQGNMIGILILGERGDHQLYAGPDFEIVQMLTARFSSVLENARLDARANYHAALLNSLYSASMMPGSTFKNIDEVAHAYTVVAANAATAGAEIWLYDEKRGELHCSVFTGSGPRLTTKACLQPIYDYDWNSLFFDGEKTWYVQHTLAFPPACLSEPPSFPFAWLPLQKGKHRLGLLVLTYPRPHFFIKEEMHVLEMFATQCVATLEDVRMTQALLIAYERQKELDYLKDRFIMTASHELRTPLTAVMGYIELLNEYNDSLPADARADFIDKARRGCDELTLLVGNIMDASRVSMDTENVKLRSIVLLPCILHVLEILEGTIKREHRAVTIAISADIVVFADDLRLRQVLLNILSNALKYSDEGTCIEIASEVIAQEAVLQVRDFGLGVPLQDQQRLFDRFVRLERDLNSSVRGAGLGLAICKQLVEVMGGRIWVESSGQAGEGSCFFVSLPLAADPPVLQPAPTQLQFQ